MQTDRQAHIEGNGRFSQFCEGTQKLTNRPTSINFRKPLQIIIMSLLCLSY